MNIATSMPKTAELKTSAVTNWLVDWLLALETLDLGETREETNKREMRTYIGMSLKRGEKEESRGETEHQREGYKGRRDPTSVAKWTILCGDCRNTPVKTSPVISNRAVTCQWIPKTNDIGLSEEGMSRL